MRYCPRGFHETVHSVYVKNVAELSLTIAYVLCPLKTWKIAPNTISVEGNFRETLLNAIRLEKTNVNILSVETTKIHSSNIHFFSIHSVSLIRAFIILLLLHIRRLTLYCYFTAVSVQNVQFVYKSTIFQVYLVDINSWIWVQR